MKNPRFNVEETRQNIFQLKYINGIPKDLLLRLKDLVSFIFDTISLKITKEKYIDFVLRLKDFMSFIFDSISLKMKTEKFKDFLTGSKDFTSVAKEIESRV